LGTPRGMVVDCRVLVCGFERKIFGRKHVREQLRSLDPSSPAIPTTPFCLSPTEVILTRGQDHLVAVLQCYSILHTYGQ
jgi:hypothetical protein